MKGNVVLPPSGPQLIIVSGSDAEFYGCIVSIINCDFLIKMKFITWI